MVRIINIMNIMSITSIITITKMLNTIADELDITERRRRKSAKRF